MAVADEKFFFHMNNFDEDFVEEDPNEEPPPPVFSESELEQAKQEAFSAGHKAATEEEKASRSQKLAQVLERLAQDTSTLFAQEQEREALYERESVALCLSVFEKLFPYYQEQHGFDELQQQIEATLEGQSGQSTIEIRVSDAYAEGVNAFISKLSEKNSALSFKVTSDETLADGDTQLLWADGGAIRRSEDMAEEIKTRLQEVLAGLGTNVHDGKENDSRVLPENTEADVSDKTSEEEVVEPEHDPDGGDINE